MAANAEQSAYRLSKENMISITFVHGDGASVAAMAKPDQSLMEVARAHNISSVLAQCGGACACATCHVLVREDWYPRLGEPDDMERDMLECLDDRRPTSRLACQILVTAALDGLVVMCPAGNP